MRSAYLRCVGFVDRMLARLWVEDPPDAGRVTQQQWQDGGSITPMLRELRIRAWNGGSALREINNSEKLLGSGAP